MSRPPRVRKRGGRGRPRRNPDPKPAEDFRFPMRLNRFIARSGVCSRREADSLIEEGRVKVDGAVVTEFATQINQEQRVEVNGKVITPTAGEYLLLNKPGDTITTKSDEKGRRTVLDLIDLDEARKGALFPVGRLDRATLGVLLLTTDGQLAHRLMHPSFEVEKLYRVRTAQPVTPEQLAQLTAGMELDDGPAAADHADYTRPDDACEVGVSMHSGRNRIVRRMFETLGHEVKELERIRYAGLTTSGVRRGKWRRLTDKEVARLYRAVKMKR